MDFYAKSIDESLRLTSSSRDGLSFDEAKRREREYSARKIDKQKNDSLVKKFLKQFSDFMILILLACAVVSFAIGIMQNSTSEIIDGSVILLIVLMNAIFGLLQENKAEKSLLALQSMTQPESFIIRNGERVKIKSENIVPGDIVVLEAGSKVPADCRLIESTSLFVDESSLTGESNAVEKNATFVCKQGTALSERKNMVFNGTTVVKGRGVAVAEKVGKDSELGKIANVLTQSKKELSPLEQSIKSLGKITTYLILGMAISTFIIELAAKFSPLDAFLTAVAISVAAIPESMPAVITIIMSLGISRLAKQKAIVKHIHSVETLGSCDVICSDKTGTLTQNKMCVTALYCDGKFSFKQAKFCKDFDLLLSAMVLCNDAAASKTNFIGDSTEVALLEYASKFCIPQSKQSSCPRIQEIPFDSERKLMSSVNKYNGENVAFVKGAIDMLIKKCDKIMINGIEVELTPLLRQRIEKANITLCEKALRVLGFAVKKVKGSFVEDGLTFLGLVGMIDPPRKEVKDAVQKCKKAGMRPVMITGDHLDTAFAIAKEIGIAESKKQVLSGQEIDVLSEERFLKLLGSVCVFARVSPENKVRIVEGYKKLGHVVAMTGDGVNDAASIKKANIGIGMGITGTDVTKEVADLIITDDNFATIVLAVEEGRKVYSNIQKTVKFLYSANMGEILALFFATMFFPQYVFLTPIQILFVNLITDSLPAIALGVEPAEKDIMLVKPRDKGKGLFSDGNGIVTLIMGFAQTILTLSSFCLGLYLFGSAIATSMAFYTLNIIQFFYLLSVRTQDSIFKSNPFKNKWCIVSILFAGGLLTLIAATPLHKVLKLASLNGYEWAYIFLVSFLMVFISEICKIFLRKRKKSKLF